MAIPRQQPVAAADPKRKHHRHRKRRRVWKDKHFRWVPDGQGDWRVQGYIYTHRHKPKKGHYRGPGKKPPRSALPPASVPASAPATADPRPPQAYQGAFGVRQATRLLQRAGFGAVPGQAEALVSLG